MLWKEGIWEKAMNISILEWLWILICRRRAWCKSHLRSMQPHIFYGQQIIRKLDPAHQGHQVLYGSAISSLQYFIISVYILVLMTLNELFFE